MEKFFFKKIELWLVLLILVLGFVGTIVFGALVRNVAKGEHRFGKIGEIAFAIASVPADLKAIARDWNSHGMEVFDSSRFGGRRGWTFGDADPKSRPDGYVLLSRYDGDAERQVIELVDLRKGKTVQRLEIHAENLLQGWKPPRKNDLSTPWIPERFRAIHPAVLPNGDLLIKDHFSPLMRITPCGTLIWRQEELQFHHATEFGPAGNVWLPTQVPLQAFPQIDPSLSNPGVAEVDPDGNILFRRSIGDLLIENGYEYLVIDDDDIFKKNPLHLNDVQPVLTDGPYWKRGDLFLSLRRPSAIVLYRPSDDKILWIKQGPWRGQHDVDIVNEHTIAVFNNDAINLGGRAQVRDHNRVMFYDFQTDKVSEPFDAALKKHDVRTIFGGLFTLLPNDHLMVEETTNGRLLITDRGGRLIAEFVNRSSDGKIHFLAWSRFLTRDRGQAMIARLGEKNCKNPTSI